MNIQRCAAPSPRAFRRGPLPRSGRGEFKAKYVCLSPSPTLVGEGKPAVARATAGAGEGAAQQTPN